MSHKFGIDAAVAIKLLFKGKDDQRLIDVLAQQSYPPLAPGPELRADVVNHGNAAFLHLAGDPPIEGGRIDHDGEIRLLAVGGSDQAVKKTPDFRQVAENFRDSHDRQIPGIDDDVA